MQFTSENIPIIEKYFLRGNIKNIIINSIYNANEFIYEIRNQLKIPWIISILEKTNRQWIPKFYYPWKKRVFILRFIANQNG